MKTGKSFSTSFVYQILMHVNQCKKLSQQTADQSDVSNHARRLVQIDWYKIFYSIDKSINQQGINQRRNE